jgi:hypothetical protein
MTTHILWKIKAIFETTNQQFLDLSGVNLTLGTVADIEEPHPWSGSPHLAGEVQNSWQSEEILLLASWPKWKMHENARTRESLEHNIT